MQKPAIRQLIIVPKYNHQVVECLEELLARAKAGEITEIIATAKLGDGTYDHYWTGSTNLMELVGVLERQKLSMLSRTNT